MFSPFSHNCAKDTECVRFQKQFTSQNALTVKGWCGHNVNSVCVHGDYRQNAVPSKRAQLRNVSHTVGNISWQSRLCHLRARLAHIAPYHWRELKLTKHALHLLSVPTHAKRALSNTGFASKNRCFKRNLSSAWETGDWQTWKHTATAVSQIPSAHVGKPNDTRRLHAGHTTSHIQNS